MLTKTNVVAEEKAALIAQAIDSDEGRVALAQAMVEPIRRALEYFAIGRKCLMVDPLPQGAYARYEKDVRCKASVIARRGGVPQSVIEGEEILVPTYEIAIYVSVRMSEIKARRFYIVDRSQIKGKEAIQKAEDTDIFNALLGAVSLANTVTATGGSLTLTALNQAFATIESHDLTVAKIIMHANRYADVRNWGMTVYDQATTREVLTSGLFGHLYTADIHVSSKMPTDTVLLLAPGDYVGAMPIRQDVTVLPADDPKHLRLGWVIYEEIGICVINDYAIAKVVVTSGS